MNNEAVASVFVEERLKESVVGEDCEQGRVSATEHESPDSLECSGPMPMVVAPLPASATVRVPFS